MRKATHFVASGHKCPRIEDWLYCNPSRPRATNIQKGKRGLFQAKSRNVGVPATIQNWIQLRFFSPFWLLI
jgi:hypothetical protein